MGQEVRDQAQAEAALEAALDRNTRALGKRAAFVRGIWAAAGAWLFTAFGAGILAATLRSLGLL